MILSYQKVSLYYLPFNVRMYKANTNKNIPQSVTILVTVILVTVID